MVDHRGGGRCSPRRGLRPRRRLGQAPLAFREGCAGAGGSGGCAGDRHVRRGAGSALASNLLLFLPVFSVFSRHTAGSVIPLYYLAQAEEEALYLQQFQTNGNRVEFENRVRTYVPQARLVQLSGFFCTRLASWNSIDFINALSPLGNSDFSATDSLLNLSNCSMKTRFGKRQPARQFQLTRLRRNH